MRIPSREFSRSLKPAASVGLSIKSVWGPGHAALTVPAHSARVLIVLIVFWFFSRARNPLPLSSSLRFDPCGRWYDTDTVASSSSSSSSSSGGVFGCHGSSRSGSCRSSSSHRRHARLSNFLRLAEVPPTAPSFLLLTLCALLGLLLLLGFALVVRFLGEKRLLRRTLATTNQ